MVSSMVFPPCQLSGLQYSSEAVPSSLAEFPDFQFLDDNQMTKVPDVRQRRKAFLHFVHVI